ncbi:selenoprotein S [Galendromus occidentalis]|uniref:Selenoprotein S n=1 Tax=Galendromus occidentalis TaxID=34638 RepID=A0AAJ6QPU1_9ACAR|nr:selenoprotein S [Galendromus occidentalis]
MAEEFEQTGLLGPKEWLAILAVAIAVYIYRKFQNALAPSSGSVGNNSATAQAISDDDIRRRNMQEARRRLIEESERKIEENREKLKEKEEQKRREQIERNEKLLDVTKKKPPGDSKSFRREYNPLMGDGGSCSWRPAKKSSARGG